MKEWLVNTLQRAAWAPVSVFVFYVVAAKVFDAYISFPGLDMPTHFAGGLAITYFYVTAIALSQKRLGHIPRLIQAIAAMGLTAITAVVWEFLEFCSDAILGTIMNLGVTDTLSDLFFGLLGGLVMVICMFRNRYM